jgi:hypothetical protein
LDIYFIEIQRPIIRAAPRRFPSISALKSSVAMPSDKIDKKRKRASDRHERPTKQPALQTLPTLAASVVEDKSELAPVIGT